MAIPGSNNTIIIERFRTEAKNFRILCAKCGVGDQEELARYEAKLADRLESLDFGQLIHKAIECGIIELKKVT